MPEPDGLGATLLAHCLAKPGAWPDHPWGDAVVKVGPRGAGKIFAFLGDTSIGVSCGSREVADELIARFPGDARPMAYIGRHGWNTVSVVGAVPAEELFELLDLSYDLVVAKLPRSRRPVS